MILFEWNQSGLVAINLDPIESILAQPSLDPMSETKPGVTRSSRGLIVANARRSSRRRVKRVRVIPLSYARWISLWLI